MVIDTSAILAILLQEDEAFAIAKAIEQDPKRLMSSSSLLETMIVIDARKQEYGKRELDLFLHKAKIEIVAFAEAQIEIAYTAWRTYGKGRHSASLNFGDCFAYALAKISNEKLLCKGNDFKQTDISLLAY